jgi:MFS family permease
VLKLTESDALLVTIAVAASNFVWLPLSGALSDRIGRKPILIAFAVLALLTAYPTLLWLVRAPTFDRMLAVELWLSFIYACYNGAMVVALTEVIPASVRTSGFSLAYSLATTLGGSSLLISTWLIAHTGDKAAPGYWMSFAAVCGLIATLALFAGPQAGSSISRPASPAASLRPPLTKQKGLVCVFAADARGAGPRLSQRDKEEFPMQATGSHEKHGELTAKATCPTRYSLSRSSAMSR